MNDFSSPGKGEGNSGRVKDLFGADLICSDLRWWDLGFPVGWFTAAIPNTSDPEKRGLKSPIDGAEEPE